jgi:hypothetical protein
MGAIWWIDWGQEGSQEYDTPATFGTREKGRFSGRGRSEAKSQG